MAVSLLTPSARRPLRGETARGFLVGSLSYSARDPAELPALAPRALDWYRHLLDVGVAAPFGAVLDLGYLFCEGEAFRFRSFFADAALDETERATRESYETRVLVRRLQETNFPRVRRLILDNAEPDLALVRVLEILFRAADLRLVRRLAVEESHSLRLEFEPDEPLRARQEFELAAGQPGLLLRLVGELAEAGPDLDLDQLIRAEDLYEIEHVRVFPRESLREVARRIKGVERMLHETHRLDGLALRDLAMADTTLESVGTYPTGGIAELTTRGPIENLVSSELVYLERDAPIDPFLVRFAENELLKYLRDSSVLRMMRRSVVFCVEDCAEFSCPVTSGGELHGTKVIRCLMGLVLALTVDLLAVFRRDDIAFTFKLLAPAGSHETAAERREIIEVLHLLFREKEEQGTVRVSVSGAGPAEVIAGLPAEPERFRTVVVIGREELMAGLSVRPGRDGRLVTVAVGGDGDGEAVTLDLSHEPLTRLRQAREVILRRMVG